MLHLLSIRQTAADTGQHHDLLGDADYALVCRSQGKGLAALNGDALAITSQCTRSDVPALCLCFLPETIEAANTFSQYCSTTEGLQTALEDHLAARWQRANSDFVRRVTPRMQTRVHHLGVSSAADRICEKLCLAALGFVMGISRCKAGPWLDSRPV